MIPSQQSMMLDLAKTFERLVKDPKVSRKNAFRFFYQILFGFVKNEEAEVIPMVKLLGIIRNN
jgi:hypothetical protein